MYEKTQKHSQTSAVQLWEIFFYTDNCILKSHLISFRQICTASCWHDHFNVYRWNFAVSWNLFKNVNHSLTINRLSSEEGRRGVCGTNPSRHRANGGVHPGQVKMLMFQENKIIQKKKENAKRFKILSCSSYSGALNTSESALLPGVVAIPFQYYSHCPSTRRVVLTHLCNFLPIQHSVFAIGNNNLTLISYLQK